MCTMKLKDVKTFLGIDLHKASLLAAAKDPKDNILGTQNIDTKCKNKIVDFVTQWPRPIACAIESVGMYEWLWELLEDKVDYLFLADATEVKRKRKRGKAKTDRNDALLMGHLMIVDDLPEAYVPSKGFRVLRKLGRHFHRTSRLTSSIKVQMRWILNQHNLPGPKNINGPTAQKWLLAHMDKIDSSSLFAFQQHLASLEKFELDKGTIVRRIKMIAKNPKLTKAFDIIRSVPGIDYVIALIVLAEIADFSRFPKGDCIAAYTGLTERTDESAGKRKPGKISHCGNPTLRWALVEATTTLVRHDKKCALMYDRLIKNVAGSKLSIKKAKAKVAIAQKLIRWIWKMMNTGQMFRKGEPTDVQRKLNMVRLANKKI